MKPKNLKLITLLALTLSVSSVFAEHRFAYRGYRGHYNDPRSHYYRNGYGADYRYPQYAPRNCRNKHIDVYYEPDVYYDPVPDYDDDWDQDDDQSYISSTPIWAGSLIGGVIGAQVGGSDSATLGGALLGASIGRDIAYRRAYRH
ncbi:MAG: hypothetical protein ACRER2_06995 [Methylococcales bacterium]